MGEVAIYNTLDIIGIMSYNYLMTNTPHTDTKNHTQTLSERLQQSLIPLEDDAEQTDILRNQMRVLHHICNRMLVDADRKYENQLMQYNLALRAQNQYRQTLMAIEALNAQGRK